MAEWNRNPIEPRGYGATTWVAAEGILNRVFLWMALGLGLTGLVAFATAANATIMQWLIQNQWAFFALLIAELGLVIALSAAINRLSTTAATSLFFLYAALNGITLSFILLAYTGESIATTFFVTGGTFGVMATFGAVTKKDLSSWGQFLFMGLIGIVIASVVNIFLGNSTMSLVISCIGVLVFTGLTAYDVQSIKRMAAGHSGESLTRIGILGALRLYLDFINLFLMLLRLTGNRR